MLKGINLSGFSLMALSMFLYSLCEATEKYLTATYEPYLILFFRSCIGLLVVFWITRKKGLKAYKPDYGWNILRNFFAGAAIFLTIYSLKHLPLSSYEFMTFTSPIFMSIFSAIFLKEKISSFILVSLVLSLIGGLVSCYPFSDAHLNLGFLFALSSSLCYSISSVITKRISHLDYFILYAVYIMTCFILSGIFSYSTLHLSLTDVPFFILIAFIHFFAFQFLIYAFRKEDLVKLSPLEYTTAVWSIIFGYILWRYIPGLKELSGGVLIIIGSIVVKRKDLKVYFKNKFNNFYLRKNPSSLGKDA